ncbi:hypothetical protein ABZ297_32865 [Nonomuraea sp. NPDC005983]|uniref:AMIN-like domain-containing (lipo)protein n=1 Tax=Nonomuraea sp. NPDC005983 TaxID=3155595 RepID=UPI0033B694DA
MRPSPAPGTVQGFARAVAGLALLAVLSACGNVTPVGSAAVSPPSPTPTPARTDDPPPTSTSEVDVDMQDGKGEPAVVKAVNWEARDGFDRIVVDFEGDPPAYKATWVKELVQDGSGDRLDVKGGAYLEIALSRAQAHTDKGAPTWEGGPVYQTNLGNVRAVVKTGDFEGRVGIGLVLDHRAGYRLDQQTSPNQLVVDVAH